MEESIIPQLEQRALWHPAPVTCYASSSSAGTRPGGWLSPRRGARFLQIVVALAPDVATSTPGNRVIPDSPFTLVLSGGGLKGLAHIGVLRALEERELVPSLVVGSSIGSLIAAAWAAGVPTRHMEAKPGWCGAGMCSRWPGLTSPSADCSPPHSTAKNRSRP